MKRRRQIFIVGGGIGGLATAFFLGAEEDLEVTLIEREPRHNAHSSGRSAEILRTAIDDPVTEALALATSDLLARPKAIGLRTGADLVDRTGLFVLNDGGAGAAWIERQTASGAARETSLKELRQAAPHFSAHPTEQERRVFHLASGGRIHGDRLLAALARGALRRGVRILRSTGDALPIVQEGRVTGVEFSGTQLPCDALVVAAGAWSSRLAEAMGAPLPLNTTRRHMWVTAGDPSAAAEAPIVWDDAAGFYVRPETGSGGVTGWAFSTTDLDEHRAARGSTDRHASYLVSEATRAEAVAAAREYLPKARLPLAYAWRGFRDLSPDDRPIIGEDPRVEGLFWCTGFGGHGMTTSLAVGQTSADAIMGRRSDLLSSCSVSRLLGLSVARD